MSSPVDRLRNLGPRSVEWLGEIGIHSIEDLRAAGAIEAFIRMKASNPRVSFLALIAMHAALQDRDWREVTADEKEILRELLASTMKQNQIGRE